MSRLRSAVVVLSTTAALAGAASPAHAADASCTRFAATTGNDAAAGTAAAPFGTVQRLVNSLGPGDTGCLATGTYTKGDSGYIAHFDRAGTAAAPITLRSAPGQRATLKGIVEIRSAAAYTTVSDVIVNGTGEQNTLKVYAKGVVVEDSDITNEHRGPSCLMLGSSSAGTATDVTIRRNVLRACGAAANGNKDHAIYASKVDGGLITDNVIVDPTAWAIQFYPDTHGLVFSHNVVDGGNSIRGGVVFGGTGESASSGNVVEQNVIANASSYGLASSWGGARGTNNVARNNCFYKAPVAEQDGFTTSGNVTADPGFRNRADEDFRLATGSGCMAVVGHDAAAVIRSKQQAGTPVAVPAAPTTQAAPATPATPATTTPAVPVATTPVSVPAVSVPVAVPAVQPTAAAVAVGAAPVTAPVVKAVAKWKGGKLRLGAKVPKSLKVSKVAFAVAGKVRATTARAPYRAVWKAPRSLANRSHRVVATVYGADGRSTQAVLTIQARR